MPSLIGRCGGGSFTPNPQEEWFQVVSVTIPGPSTTQLAWSRLSGPLIMDTTVPTQPTFKVRGVYTVDIVAEAGAAASTLNHFQLSANMVQGLYTGQPFAQDVEAADLTAAIEASISMTGVMQIGDSAFVKILNSDTANRDFFCPSIRVTKILEF